MSFGVVVRENDMHDAQFTLYLYINTYSYIIYCVSPELVKHQYRSNHRYEQLLTNILA